MLTYLACPYSHPSPKVRRQRLKTVNRVAARLVADGRTVFSPLTHNVPLKTAAHALGGTLPYGWDFWKTYDLRFLRLCDDMLVLKLDGWTTSVGVQEEIAAAHLLNIPVTYLGPNYVDEGDVKAWYSRIWQWPVLSRNFGG